MSSTKKLIAVIGGTGAQGLHVIKALLEPGSDGSPSPYTVRVLTRNDDSSSAKELKTLGVELVIGSFMDFTSVAAAFEGAYGAFVNTDGFTVGEEAEIFAGMRIFELAKQAGIRHYVWGNLDYVFKKSGYNTKYRTEHYDGKGRVAEWLRAQPSEANGLTWSVLTSGPYMELLNFHMFGPINKRADGTFVFASPVGAGQVPMISLRDLGFFGRYIFDHPATTSAQDLEVMSEFVGWDRLVSAFTAVTGQKAVYVPQTLDAWFSNFHNTENPVASDFYRGWKEGLHREKTTFRKNFEGFWSLWRDNIITRDMEWVRSVHPGVETLEVWMKRVGYTGEPKVVLKIFEKDAGERFSPNIEKTRRL